MNVVLLHYAAPPVVGGVESVLYHQARQLTAAGHHVQVLAGRGEQWDPQIPVATLPFLDSRHPAILSVKASLDQGSLPPDFPRVEEELLVSLSGFFKDVDVVIAHNVASLNKNLPLTAALWRLSQTSSTPRFILWHHDLAWNSPNYRGELHPGYPWDLLRTPWPGVRQVTISTARQQELSILFNIPAREIMVIPGGIDLSEFLGLPTSIQTLVKNLGLDQAAPLLLTPVRLTRRKNLELALHILAAVRREMPQAALVITGPPGAHNPSNLDYHRALQALRHDLNLEGSAHLLADFFPHGLDDHEIAALYRLADSLLLTSREEGFGIPILEAALAHLPIFSTDLPSLKALTGENASHFSPDENPECVARMIVDRLTTDPVYTLRTRIRQDFTWQAITTRCMQPLLETL